jgi:hypothetical protein
MKTRGRLIAVDGVSAPALEAAITDLRSDGYRGAGISRWDASRIFSELEDDGEGVEPSARVLVLLYATDLAFRLRREIQPALAEGRVVIAAPYVDTAVAFGRAAGLRGSWLDHVFNFAPPAAETHRAARPRHHASDQEGFIEFGCARAACARSGLNRQRLMERAAAFLKKTRGPRR